MAEPAICYPPPKRPGWWEFIKGRTPKVMRPRLAPLRTCGNCAWYANGECTDAPQGEEDDSSRGFMAGIPCLPNHPACEWWV